MRQHEKAAQLDLFESDAHIRFVMYYFTKVSETEVLSPLFEKLIQNKETTRASDNFVQLYVINKISTIS